MERVFSGIRPTGVVHIGNYFGAMINWIRLQEKYHCLYCVVDYHAFTSEQNPQILKEKIIETTKIYLAAGIDSKKSIIFKQSDIQEHTELSWILSCLTKFSEMKRMTQFKEKSKTQAENVNVGLFNYPVLMAADILLYQTEIVPVGEDQVQHVEMARLLSRDFNRLFGDTFIIPKALIETTGAQRIMALDNPVAKMDKSADDPNNYIGLLDKPQVAEQKIKRAQTDSSQEIKYDPINKPGISNLLLIYFLIARHLNSQFKNINDIEEQYQGKGYEVFKKDLADMTKQFLTDFHKKYYAIDNHTAQEVLVQGAKQAKKIAQITMQNVKQKIGCL
jgi:tryptophanyl-tRNA synthetase